MQSSMEWKEERKREKEKKGRRKGGEVMVKV